VSDALRHVFGPSWLLLRHGVVDPRVSMGAIASGILVVTIIEMCIVAGFMLSR
jgi:hypothetical protein